MSEALYYGAAAIESLVAALLLCGRTRIACQCGMVFAGVGLLHAFVSIGDCGCLRGVAVLHTRTARLLASGAFGCVFAGLLWWETAWRQQNDLA